MARAAAAVGVRELLRGEPRIAHELAAGQEAGHRLALRDEADVR